MHAQGRSTPKKSWAWRWSAAGMAAGMLLGLILFAPAAWLARSIEQSTNGHLLLSDARGSIWAGSAVLALGGGRGSRDSSTLPGRIEWTMGLVGNTPALRLRQACCLNGELTLLVQAGWGSGAITVAAGNSGDKTWLARWPTAWMSGLGTPWNTLQLSGSVRLSGDQLRLAWAQGRWIQTGQLALDFVNLSSRVCTVEPLGNYRFSVIGEAAGPGVSRLQLSTLDGALLLSGEGTFGAGKARFLGEAKAAAGRESALDNLLNIIGRRQGVLSVISIG